MFNIRSLILVSSVLYSFAVCAADDCGEVPAAPQIVDGATATMEDLVANSESVKSFVANADAYLDCREAFAKEDAFKSMTGQERKAYTEANGALLELRNSIGPSFNEQVGVYTKSHPETE